MISVTHCASRGCLWTPLAATMCLRWECFFSLFNESPCIRTARRFLLEAVRFRAHHDLVANDRKAVDVAALSSSRWRKDLAKYLRSSPQHPCRNETRHTAAVSEGSVTILTVFFRTTPRDGRTGPSGNLTLARWVARLVNRAGGPPRQMLK